MNAIYILWLRQVKRYVRSRPRIIASLGQPLLFLLALGFGFGPIFQKAGQGNYIQFLAPGVIGMTMLFTSIFSGIELIWDRQFGFLKETLVAPVPRILIMIGRTLGGATVAMIQGMIVVAICFAAGFRVSHFAAADGLLVHGAGRGDVHRAGHGDRVRALRLSGLPVGDELSGDADFLSVRRAVPFDQPAQSNGVIATLDPLTYGVDGLRGALNGAAAGHFSASLDLAVLSIIAAGLLAAGGYLFSKIQL